MHRSYSIGANLRDRREREGDFDPVPSDDDDDQRLLMEREPRSRSRPAQPSVLSAIFARRSKSVTRPTPPAAIVVTTAKVKKALPAKPYAVNNTTIQQLGQPFRPRGAHVPPPFSSFTREELRKMLMNHWKCCSPDCQSPNVGRAFHRLTVKGESNDKEMPLFSLRCGHFICGKCAMERAGGWRQVDGSRVFVCRVRGVLLRQCGKQHTQAEMDSLPQPLHAKVMLMKLSESGGKCNDCISYPFAEFGDPETLHYPLDALVSCTQNSCPRSKDKMKESCHYCHWEIGSKHATHHFLRVTEQTQISKQRIAKEAAEARGELVTWNLSIPSRDFMILFCETVLQCTGCGFAYQLASLEKVKPRLGACGHTSCSDCAEKMRAGSQQCAVDGCGASNLFSVPCLDLHVITEDRAPNKFLKCGSCQNNHNKELFKSSAASVSDNQARRCHYCRPSPKY